MNTSSPLTPFGRSKLREVLFTGVVMKIFLSASEVFLLLERLFSRQSSMNESSQQRMKILLPPHPTPYPLFSRQTNPTIVWTVVSTVNSGFCIRYRRIHCTLKAVICREKLTAATGNLMHSFSCSYTGSNGRPHS